METMDYLDLLSRKKRGRSEYKCYRQIRFTRDREGYKELLKLVNEKRRFRVEMYEEYFPVSLEDIAGTVITYDEGDDKSLIDMLYWGQALLVHYAERIREYLSLKERYEDLLFANQPIYAEKTLDAIERKICSSLWGIQQKFLILGIQNKKKEIEDIYGRLNAAKNQYNSVPYICFYYKKLVDSSVDFENYKESIENFASEKETLSFTSRYVSYKINIFEDASTLKLKAALVYDEQLSVIDYYETYIHVLQVLSENIRYKAIVSEIVRSFYGVILDYRVRNLYIALGGVDANLGLHQDVCDVIEAYTYGDYEKMQLELPANVDKVRVSFNLCNLYVKAGVSLSVQDVLFPQMWEEIEKVYELNYESNSSIEKIGGYYKLLYGTSWRYKLLRILCRKLKYPYKKDVLRISILNDKAMTPLFYQCIDDEQKKMDYLFQFSNYAPVTASLHMYMLTGRIEPVVRDKVEPGRLKYYEIKWLVHSEQYEQAIAACLSMLVTDCVSAKEMYCQERFRRILYECYMHCERYLEAMRLYVESYLLGNEQIVQMNPIPLVEAVEGLAEEDDDVKADVCRPIIRRLYYKSEDGEIISSYLDYLEAQGCDTIIEYLDKKDTLTAVEILFLDKVCTQTLLMQDYLSKTETKGSVAELRASILRKLIKVDEDNQNIYLTELNSVYKMLRLRTRMDSFNHNRIFIDKENLFKYLNDKLKQEFVKFVAVQDIRKVVSSTKNDSLQEWIKDMHNYWDKNRFYKDMVGRIADAYLSESPYSLENFLSTRIRHNYCNDNLKKEFEAQKLFSLKRTDDSEEYVVNEYWENLLSKKEYGPVIGCLSDFSKRIDQKIQEIKANWIRISTHMNEPGLFVYWSFADYLVDYQVVDFDDLAVNPEAFFRIVIHYLDAKTNHNLGKIRQKIDAELKPYYYDAIIGLESDVKKLNFTSRYKKEMLNKIEITKAKYIEDLDRFKRIFHMENEVYPDFDFSELVEFCCKIEEEMNPDFAYAAVKSNIRNSSRFSGDIFSYMVDIIGILIRNAVQHSEIVDMKKLGISIDVVPFHGSEMEQHMKGEINSSIYKFVISVTNNLADSVDPDVVRENAAQKVSGIYDGRYREESNREGGTGLYKIARTVVYNLNTHADYYFKVTDKAFQFCVALNLDKYIK